jgi:hypothetical protein
LADPEQPLEILRTLHSFDPRLACSTHVMSADGQEMANIRVRWAREETRRGASISSIAQYSRPRACIGRY